MDDIREIPGERQIDMAYDPDWTRPGGWWKVEDVYDDKTWPLQGGDDNPDKLTIHGDGTGTNKADDLLKKNGGSLATNCSHAVTKEEVEVSFKGKTYVIRLQSKMLTCIEKGLSSGNVSWTAVEGGV